MWSDRRPLGIPPERIRELTAAAGRVTGASWVFMRSASSTDRQLLQRWLKAPTTPQRVVRRSRIVLFAIDGMREQDIAAKVGVSRPTVRLWLARFDKLGVEGLLRDAPGRGRRSSLDPAQVRQRLAEGGLLNAEGKPVSLRRAAAFLGTSPSALWRALKKVPR